MIVNRVIRSALGCLGRPYVFNAQAFQSRSFDCSSFVQFVFYVNGILLPRSSRQQFSVGQAISFSSIKKGDLLFFTTNKRKKKKGLEKIGHVALYIGKNQMIHTYTEGKKVMISDVNSYWRSAFIGAKRVIES